MPTSRGDLQRSGIADENTDHLGRDVFTPGYLPVAKTVEIRGGALWWTKARWETQSAPPHLLDAFLALSRRDAKDEDFKQFATKWGGFGLCREHNLPPSHLLERKRDYSKGTQPRFRALESICRSGFSLPVEVEYLEPLSVWRGFAAQAAALVAIAARLHQGQRAYPHHWEQLRSAWTAKDDFPERIDSIYLSAPNDPPVLIDHEKLVVAEAMQLWLGYGAIRPRFHWGFGGDDSPPIIALAGGGVFASLAVQLLWAVSARERTTIVCTGCGRPYTPERRPRLGEDHYCQQCRRTGAPERAAKRRYQRKMSVLRCRDLGWSPKTIARKLGIEVHDVAGILAARRHGRAR